MKQKDEIIKEILRSKMQKMDDETFTQRVVDQHIKTRISTNVQSTFDFISLILGLIAMIISVGVGFLVQSSAIPGLTIQHSLILFSISVAYLMFSLLNDIIITKRMKVQ